MRGQIPKTHRNEAPNGRATSPRPGWNIGKQDEVESVRPHAPQPPSTALPAKQYAGSGRGRTEGYREADDDRPGT